MKLSLIVGTYRYGGFDCLFGSLKNQTLSRNEWEVIVADDLYNIRKSEVKKYADLLDINLQHFKPPKSDKPFACGHSINWALRYAEGDFIMIGQDFLWLEPDCFERHLKLQRPDQRVTVGLMHHAVAPPLDNLKGKLTVFDRIHEEKPQTIELPDIRFGNVEPLPPNIDVSPFTDRETFAKFVFHMFCTSYSVLPNATFSLPLCIHLNGYDERLDIGHGFNDDNFCFRTHLLGFDFILDKKNVMYHITHPWSRKTQHPRQHQTYYQNNLAILGGFAGIKAPNPFDLIQERVRVRNERWLKTEGGTEQPVHPETYEKPLEQKRIHWLKSECKNTTNILEIGCSGGYLLNLLDGKTGIDKNPQIIEANKKHYPNKRWVTGDVTKGLPFKNNEFDIVLCTGVLEHIPFQQTSYVLKECIRVAKHKVLVTLPNATHPFYNRQIVENFKHKWAATPDKVHALSLTYITAYWQPPPNFQLQINFAEDNNLLYWSIRKKPKSTEKSKLMKRAEELKKIKEEEAKRLRRES